MDARNVVPYIAASLDGCIAKGDDDLVFLSIVSSAGEDYGYGDFVRTVDTVIMGRKTYDKVLSFGVEFPHKASRCFVLSRTRTGKDQDVEFFGGDISDLLARRLTAIM